MLFSVKLACDPNMSEASLWALIKINLALKMYRVESRVTAGIPDIHYITPRGSGWIELKYIKEFPMKGKMQIGLRKAQFIWHKTYALHGGKSWIILRVGRNSLLLLRGKDAEKINKMPCTADFIDLASWSHFGNMRLENWSSLKEEIINGKENREDSSDSPKGK
jgi:hypothetical protein